MSRPYLLLNELKANYIQNQPMNIEFRPTFDRRNIRADTLMPNVHQTKPDLRDET